MQHKDAHVLYLRTHARTLNTYSVGLVLFVQLSGHTRASIGGTAISQSRFFRMYISQKRQTINENIMNIETLSRKERLSYVLQLRILQMLSNDNAEKKDLGEKIEAFQGGYEGMYEDIFNDLGVSDSSLSQEACEKVWSILEMYRGMIDSYNRLVEDKKITNLTQSDVAFPGFSEHDDEECKMMFFVRYFIGKLGRFSEISYISNPDFNSHVPMLNHYENMLKIWDGYVHDQEQNPYLMSEEQIINLLKAGKLWKHEH